MTENNIKTPPREEDQNSAAGQLTARVHSIETGGAVDGPGIRYLIFFQGCNFKCIYCHNRDTWDMEGGTVYTVEALMKEIITYAPFFNASGGGVTCTGGEASLQAKFIAELFREVHAAGFNTCLDTNGYFHYTRDQVNLINETDTFLLDIKAMDPLKHKELTGFDNERVLTFARYRRDHGKKMWIRQVIIPSYTDDDENAHALGKFIVSLGDAVERVELLAYHELGKHKWKFFNEPYKLENISPPKKEVMDHLRGILREYFKETY